MSGFTPAALLQMSGFYPTRNFGHFLAALLKMSDFTPPEILTIFGPFLAFWSSEMSWTREHLKNTQTPLKTWNPKH